MCRGRSLLVAAVAATLLATGCSHFEKADLDTDNGGSDTSGDVLTGWVLLDSPFAAPTPPGEAINDSASTATATGGADGKPVLVNVWSSTCGPCKKEMPELEAYDRAGKVSVVGVSEDVRRSAAEEALAKAGTTYPSWLDDDVSYLDALRTPGYLPTSALVVDGQVIALHVGEFRSQADFAKIDRYVKAARAAH